MSVPVVVLDRRDDQLDPSPIRSTGPTGFFMTPPDVVFDRDVVERLDSGGGDGHVGSRSW
jgi:hypothetical protein